MELRGIQHNGAAIIMTSGHNELHVCTAAERGRASVVFTRWRQCTPHLIHGSLTHWTRHPKLHIGRYSHFWTALGRESLYCVAALKYVNTVILTALELGLIVNAVKWSRFEDKRPTIRE